MRAFLQELTGLCLLKTAVDLLLPASAVRRIARLTTGLLVTGRLLLALRDLLEGGLL